MTLEISPTMPAGRHRQVRAGTFLKDTSTRSVPKRTFGQNLGCPLKLEDDKLIRRAIL